MEYRELSYTLGMQLRIPTINIDVAFVEALCVSNCFAKTLILSAINTTYENMRKLMMTTNIDNEVEDTFGIKCYRFVYILRKISHIFFLIL